MKTSSGKISTICTCTLTTLLLTTTLNANQTKSLVFGEENKGKVVEIPVGKTFHVKLPSNPTTGYSLYLATNGQEPWQLVSRTYRASESKGKVGVGGFETMTFRAKKRGQGQIIVIPARSFDFKESIKQSEAYILKVTVK